VITPFERDREAHWKTKLWESLTNAAILLGCFIVMSIVLVLLYKFRCYKVGITSMAVRFSYRVLFASKLN